MAISLAGFIRTPDQDPVGNAVVQLVAPAELLQGVQGAAIHRQGAVSWTRVLTGFSSHRWNCWQQHVKDEVAGITWDEFKKLI